MMLELLGEGIMSNRLSFCGDTVYMMLVKQTREGLVTVFFIRRYRDRWKKEVVYEYEVLAIIKYLKVME